MLQEVVHEGRSGSFVRTLLSRSRRCLDRNTCATKRSSVRYNCRYMGRQLQKIIRINVGAIKYLIHNVTSPLMF